MAKKIKVLTDKYKSTTKIYPKIVEECLPEDILNKLDDSTKVVANPTLAGTEGDLESIEIGDTKYKVGGGKQLYQHNIRIYSSDTLQELLLKIINDNNTQFDLTSLNTWLLNNGFSENANMYYECSGGKTTGGGAQTFFIMGVCYNNSDNTTLKIRGGQYTTMGTWSIALSSVNIKDTIIPL